MATPKLTPKETSRRPHRVIHFLTQEEVKWLFAVIKLKRDRAIFLLASRHGLWASEIGLLQRTDVDLKQGRLTVHRLIGSGIPKLGSSRERSPQQTYFRCRGGEDSL